MRDGFQIIDTHCHIYPEKIAAKAVAGRYLLRHCSQVRRYCRQPFEDQ